MTNLNVNAMSVKDMQNTIFDIMTDNGMPDGEAADTVANMGTEDMKRYLSEVFDTIDEDN